MYAVSTQNYTKLRKHPHIYEPFGTECSEISVSSKIIPGKEKTGRLESAQFILLCLISKTRYTSIKHGTATV